MSACTICGTILAEGAIACGACGTPVDAAARRAEALPLGTHLLGGAYRVGRVLGQGGFGITYLGSDTRLQRPVAIKEFFPQGCVRRAHSVQPSGVWTAASYGEAKARFIQEGQTLARFDHPGIVHVLSAHEENGTAYLVMEYVQGKTLAQRLDECGWSLE